MMQRPTNRRGKRPAVRPAQPAEMLRQQAVEEMPPVNQAYAAEVEDAAGESLPPYRACASANDQPLAPGEVLSWGQPGWPWQTALPLGGAQNLLLLNMTFVAETDGLAQWTLRCGDHVAAVLSCQVQAYQPVTLMYNTRLPAEEGAALTLGNDSELTVVVQQGSLNLLALEA